MTKDEIKAALDEAGIEYDARLGVEKLEALLPKNDAEPVAAQKLKSRGVLCVVQRDYWPTPEDIEAGWPVRERNRVRAGSLIEIEAEAALDGVESGMLSRYKG